ncbi:phosphatidylinositol phosphate kinase [Chloropicon primus]|nr:phosphatidylinositol phosphate kinase [Chloropicon primus]UPR03499.1 phosphatidylinositol phosphate kinase [Chloropicon primus]|eukprot:QDZ24292.1 phosphatidylinositol phosphate kinase [Chloropicon primus]
MANEMESDSCRHTFPNGDVYHGAVENDLPHGYGKYEWSDGSFYEGEWSEGVKHGYGKYKWASGSSYEGQWSEGCMHGIGTYTGSDDSEYHGSFVKDKKSGYGKKKYPNGDIYEGLWKNDLAENLGIYHWLNGDKFNGEWRQGKMHGHGTFVWHTGERYDGDWKTGLENGPGLFIWADGSAFYGFWEDGKKHGSGVWWRELDASGGGGAGATPRPKSPNDATADKLTVALSENKVIGREYNKGKLVKEHWIDRDKVCLPSLRATREPAKKTKKYAKKVQGETIVKGHRSYDLMLNLQLGIRYNIGKVNEESVKELEASDFDKNISRQIFFPHNGSEDTPPHSSTDFYWKTYCPRVFRDLRKRFGCDPGQYVYALCGDHALRELSSPGKSGSVFYISHDDQYLCKSLRKSELNHLSNILPAYHKHISEHSNTILPKFYGLHRITNPQKSQRVRFVVMANVFCRDINIHRMYDLKGSVVGRSSGNITESTILKDLDLDCTFKLERKWHDILFDQLEKDCKLLEKMNIMDYSLLLGIHFTDEEENSMMDDTTEDDDGGMNGDQGVEEAPLGTSSSLQTIDEDADSRSFLANLNKLNKVTSTKERRTSEIFHQQTRTRRSDTMRPVITEDLEKLSEAMGVSYSQRVLGVSMPATVIYNDESKEPRDALLFFAIIDILQDYNARKQLENVSKSVVYKRNEISAVSPKMYSKRFQDFLGKVFV